MSDENDGTNSDGEPTPRVSENRPLDAMLPELSEPSAAEAKLTGLHPRVLEVEVDAGYEWAMALWSDPGPVELRHQLSRLLKATLLAEMSLPPTYEDLEGRSFVAVQLLVFDGLREDSEAVLVETGFEPVDYVADAYAERMSAWRQEAAEAGEQLAARPASVWRAPFERAEATIAGALDRINARMIAELSDDVWGDEPGKFSKVLAGHFRQTFNAPITPDREGLRQFDLFLVQECSGRLRWLPPMVFQGLCDFVAVLLQREHPGSVQWAVSNPTEEGFAPPPLLRAQVPGGYRFVPVGARVIDWCLAACRPDATPSMGDGLDALLKLLKQGPPPSS